MSTASRRPARSLGAAGLAALALAGCKQEYGISSPPDISPEDVLECPFTEIEDTPLLEYDCNPVFTGTDEGWGDGFMSVGFRTQNVLGHPFYQIWYSANPDGVSEGDYGLGYAVSGDGITWDTHPANPLIEEDGGWDRDQMDAIQVVWDELSREYVLAYQGYNLSTDRWGLGLFTSDDGVDWREYNDGQPVLDLSRPVNGVTYCWPLGFSHTEERGYFGYLAGNPSGDNVCQIYKFAAQSLENGFEFDERPILEAGPERYDRSGMVGAAPVELDGTWYLFYIGFREWQQGNGYQSSFDHTLNLATSEDGVVWTKHPDNPLPVERDVDGAITAIAAEVVGSRIHLWITDYYEDIDQQAVGYYLYEP